MDADIKALHNRQYRVEHKQQLDDYIQHYHATHKGIPHVPAPPPETRLTALLRQHFDVVRQVGLTTTEITVKSVYSLSWPELDKLMRRAIANTSAQGAMTIAIDGTACVVFEALVLFSRRQDMGPVGYQRAYPEEVDARRIHPGEEPVKERQPSEPLIGVRQVYNRWVATASVPNLESPRAPRKIVSIGTAATQEDAARMHDTYVLSLWIDKKLRKAPRLNYPLDTYRELFHLERHLTTD